MNIELYKKCSDILYDYYRLQSLMCILDRYFESELDCSKSVEHAYQLFNFIYKRHNKIINKIEKLSTIT